MKVHRIKERFFKSCRGIGGVFCVMVTVAVISVIGWTETTVL